MSLLSKEEFIAEIKSNFSKLDDANLIDDISIERDIDLALKGFGNDIMQLQDVLLEVKNGKVNLPQGFFSLDLAFKCEPKGYTTESTVDHNILQESNFFIEKTRRDKEWVSCDSCCTNEKESTVVEKLYFKDNKVNFHYNRPQLLRLGKSFKKSKCTKGCRNMFVKESPYEIVIVNNTLQTNFEEGYIYMKYMGLPTDEQGETMIPDSKNGNLTLYLEYFVKKRLAERLIGNGDALYIQGLYQTFVSEERRYLKNASNELKMTRITPNTMKRLRNLSRMESLQYVVNMDLNSY